MLIQLTISQFTLVEHLTIDFSQGMTVITGETGAGKSTALDALSLVLGAEVIAKWSDKVQINHHRGSI